MSEPRAVIRESAEVVVVGGGPAGLTAAAALARAGVGPVVVLDREREMGGVPRHAQHQGFGARDLRRVMSGPHYAARITDRAASSGAQLRTETQVTGWAGNSALELTGPRGRSHLEARAVVLATGCRERPRSARLVPGSRPQGLITTGTLQQLVYVHGHSPGRRAVIVGAEHVSFSALITLAHAGARAEAIVTDQPRHESFALVRAGAALRFRTPLRTRTSVSAIHGHRRVQAVELTHLDTGEVQTVSCDLVVFTADWIPDHELAVLAGAVLDPATGCPLIDPALRTSRPGVFAAGNLLHGAEPADVAALSGRCAAGSVLRYLEGEAWPTARLPIECVAPLRWIVPAALPRQPDRDLRPPRGRFLVRADEALSAPLLDVSQDGRSLWRGRLARLGPGRSTTLPAAWTATVNALGGPIAIRVIRARRGHPAAPSARHSAGT